MFKSTDGGVTWSATGRLNNGGDTLAIDPTTPTTLYVATAAGVFKSTDGGTTWDALANPGLTTTEVFAVALAPTTPVILYAGTNGVGVFSIQQIAVCVGDCDGGHDVTMNDLITLVNIALGTEQPTACANGLPTGGAVDIAVIIQAVTNALNGCDVNMPGQRTAALHGPGTRSVGKGWLRLRLTRWCRSWRRELAMYVGGRLCLH